jgi:hypothetical protein
MGSRPLILLFLFLFMFQITEIEIDDMVSKNAIPPRDEKKFSTYGLH